MYCIVYSTWYSSTSRNINGGGAWLIFPVLAHPGGNIYTFFRFLELSYKVYGFMPTCRQKLVLLSFIGYLGEIENLILKKNGPACTLLCPRVSASSFKNLQWFTRHGFKGRSYRTTFSQIFLFFFPRKTGNICKV